MATATHAAPINIEQINTEFYVTPRPGGFDTIQKAVDYVRVHNGSSGSIIIEQGVDVADSIPAVTGGGYSILIWDHRAGSMQQWGWDGAKYVPYGFDQLAGYIARGAPGRYEATTILDYTPAGGAGNGRGDIGVTANAGKGMPAIALTCYPSDGTAGRTFFRGDESPLDGRMRVQMPAALYLTPPDDLFNMWIGQPHDINISKGMYIWTKPSENAVDLQALTSSGIYDQTLRLNPLGGNVEIARGGITAVSELQTGDLNITGDTHQTGDLFLAGNATMGRLTCIEIEGSTIDGNPAPLTVLTGLNSDGDVNVEGNLSVTGDASITGELLATSATFEECLVDGSPVRTFANTPDGGGGGTFPPAGVGVSTGTAWATSIDPATLAYRNQNNTFTGQMVIQSADPSKQLLEIVNPTITQGTIKAFDIGKAEAVNKKFFCNFYYDGDSSTFNNYVEFTFWGVPTSLFIHPGGACVGSPLRKDAAFCVSGTSHLYDALRVDGLLTLISNVGNVTTPASGGTILGWNLQTGNGHTDFINLKAGAGGGFSWYIAAPSTTLTALTVPSMIMDSNGSLSMTGGISVKGGSAIIDGTMRITFDNPSATAYLDACGSGAARAGLLLRQWAVGATNPVVSLAFDTSGNAAFAANVTASQLLTAGGCLNVRGNGASIDSSFHVAYLSGTTYMDSYGNGGGRGLFVFRQASNGAGLNQQTALSIDNSGNATFLGTITAAGKSFKITHPLDETKDLYHTCLEGPEWGVYYRGEVTIKNGSATVTLPDYFELLTFPADRSVLLTQVLKSDTDELAILAATRVEGGKFKIRSSVKSGTVAWEVKAVRRIGVDRLQVARVRAKQEAA